MKSKTQIGKALGKVPSGLFIVTAKCGDREDAVLASWVNQCSFDPPSISIVLATLRPARLLIEASKSFVLNVLAKDANGLIKHFSKPPQDDLFKGLKTSKGFHGIRILDDAISYLECNVTQSLTTGDHVLYVGEVVGGKLLSDGEPYFHVRSNGFNY